MMSWLKEPQLQGQSPGTARFFALQKAIIQQRPLLKWCYDDWYARLQADARSVAGPGTAGGTGQWRQLFEGIGPIR